MNVEEVRLVGTSYPGVTESFPFDEQTLVLKVGGKIFALLSLDENPWLNLKCDPERAIELRERYPDIIPGYHMNKKHWNTLKLEGILPDALVKELMMHSYQLVYQTLPAKLKIEINTKD